jgi:hypothetical protein
MKNTLQTLKSKGLVQDSSDETTISNIPAEPAFIADSTQQRLAYN